MFVITADQVKSRSTVDLAGSVCDSLNARYTKQLLLPADRNAGDEIQVLTDDAHTTLDIILELTRNARWSVGLGCGTVRTPLPNATREASGPAFFAARDAVEMAKKRPNRFTARSQRGVKHASSTSATDEESLIALLLLLRDRRTRAGWELYDLVTSGLTQHEAAKRLGITPPSVSSRARSAGIKAEQAAIPALTKMLGSLDRRSTETDAPK